MGVIAGELVNRSNKQNVSISSFWLHGILIPYMCSCDGLHEVTYSHILHLSIEDKNQMAIQDLDYWKKRSNLKVAFLLSLTLVVSIVNSCLPSNILGAVWLQAIVPYCNLDIIVSLTLDKGESLIASILRINILQFIGKIGMTIYCLVCYIFIIILSYYHFHIIMLLSLSNKALSNDILFVLLFEQWQ
jgi:peptidoglycan/LPS O-acetylase OafA/YrhL